MSRYESHRRSSLQGALPSNHDLPRESGLDRSLQRDHEPLQVETVKPDRVSHTLRPEHRDILRPVTALSRRGYKNRFSQESWGGHWIPPQPSTRERRTLAARPRIELPWAGGSP